MTTKKNSGDSAALSALGSAGAVGAAVGLGPSIAGLALAALPVSPVTAAPGRRCKGLARATGGLLVPAAYAATALDDRIGARRLRDHLAQPSRVVAGAVAAAITRDGTSLLAALILGGAAAGVAHRAEVDLSRELNRRGLPSFVTGLAVRALAIRMARNPQSRSALGLLAFPMGLGAVTVARLLTIRRYQAIRRDLMAPDRRRADALEPRRFASRSDTGVSEAMRSRVDQAASSLGGLRDGDAREAMPAAA